MITAYDAAITTLDAAMELQYTVVMINYLRPARWMQYDPAQVLDVLSEAKAAVLSLNTVPYQKRWVDDLQKMELKREVAGTSRIEGAEFTERELDRVMKKETPDELYTRSQRQAAAALTTYEWIRVQPRDRPVTMDLVLHIHRLIVTNADDDHCPPGVVRASGENVTFGTPQHRGVEGGLPCTETLTALVTAINSDFVPHDPLVQAIAAHFYFAAMHPFLDGNGRTARALEAFMLRRAQLRDTTFVAMSNYYYDEKTSYLKSLAQVRERDNDLTLFLRFALKGVELQAKRLLREINIEIKRELFRSLMHNLFGRLKSSRRRVIAERQVRVLELLLTKGDMDVSDFVTETKPVYEGLKNSSKGLSRDVGALLELGAVRYDHAADVLAINLEWPTEMTETAFFGKVKKMPTASMKWLTK